MSYSIAIPPMPKADVLAHLDSALEESEMHPPYGDDVKGQAAEVREALHVLLEGDALRGDRVQGSIAGHVHTGEDGNGPDFVTLTLSQAPNPSTQPA